MRKRTKTVSVIAAALVGISCFSMPVFADGIGDRNEINKNEDTLDPSAEAGATIMDAMDENGVFTGYHKEMQDTSTIITDTTDVKEVEKEELSAKEEKEAWANWIESLYNESECVLTEGYEDGTITRVLKSHMNRIPELRIIDEVWVPCDPDDIGAVRFENGSSWTVKDYTIIEDAWRIEGFKADDILDERIIPVDKTDATKDLVNALGIGNNDVDPNPNPEPTKIVEKIPGEEVENWVPYVIKKTLPYRYQIKDYVYKKLEEIKELTEKEEPRYYWVENGETFWVPTGSTSKEILKKIMDIYASENVDIFSTTLYEELVVDKVVVGQTVKEQWIDGTEAWTVHKLNEETKQWEYVDSYKSTRKDKFVDIYFNEAGTYLIKEFQSCRRTISKRYYYHWRKTLVLDDFGLILGVRENVPTPERVEKEDLYVDTNEIVTQELRDLDNSFIQPIEERGLWMISPNGVGTSATIRRVE